MFGDAADWLALAQRALLDHVHRGDARHALQMLLGALARQLGLRCTLRAEGADGTLRWQAEAAPGIDRPAVPDGEALALPLSRLGRPVGTLLLHAATSLGGDARRLGEALEPVRSTAAALLYEDGAADQAPARHAGTVEMIRGALRGGGTFVWEWDIDSDWLGDIDDGLEQLGYDAQDIGRTQEAWNRLIHPDDVAANHEAYLRHARGETGHYEHAYRVRASDGRWRWYQERGRIVEWRRRAAAAHARHADRHQRTARARAGGLAAVVAAGAHRPACAGHPLPVRAGCGAGAALPVHERRRALAARHRPAACRGRRHGTDEPHRPRTATASPPASSNPRTR